MAKTFKNLQDEVLLKLYGFGLRQPRATFLTQPADTLDTTLFVASTTDLEMGVAEVGGEMVFIESIDEANKAVVLSPDGRGYYGTTPESHGAGARLTFAPVWPRQQVREAINQTIISTWPTLFGVGQTQFTFTPAQTTYSIPAEAERVLSIAADTFGPSREQQLVRRYRFDSTAPVDEYATTNSLTLEEGVSPGVTVTVTYTKQPSELSTDSDLLTASGLRETARRLVVLGAAADLAGYMDVARLSVDTTMADELDDRNQLGLSTRIANQLSLQFEMELEKERQRLRQTTPVAINVRKR